MKRKLTLILSFCAFAISCTNSSGTKDPNTDTNDKASAAEITSSAGNKGTITCVMDGQQKAFTIQQSFFEISLGIDPNVAKDGLEILDGDAKKEGFQFEFKKIGTTRIKTDATGDMNCIINYYNPQGITYTGEDVTVVVSSYDQNHLTGTFSGKLINAYYDEGTKGAKNYPKHIQITDGKFDLQK
jgi:hypothetical protein